MDGKMGGIKEEWKRVYRSGRGETECYSHSKNED